MGNWSYTWRSDKILVRLEFDSSSLAGDWNSCYSRVQDLHPASCVMVSCRVPFSAVFLTQRTLGFRSKAKGMTDFD